MPMKSRFEYALEVLDVYDPDRASLTEAPHKRDSNVVLRATQRGLKVVRIDTLPGAEFTRSVNTTGGDGGA
jgi:hypothetical protein